MDKKILIFEDNGAKNQFIANCETTKDQANDLINLFQTFQDLATITTVDQFNALVYNPIDYFDEVLRTGLDLQAKGGREPEPSVLAKLFGYQREDYVKSIQGMPVTSTDCEGCKTKKIIRKTKPAITSARWEAYKDFLIFTPSGFKLNEAEITEYCKKFDFYAETPQQLETVELFTQLVDVLNRIDALSPLAPTDKEHLTRMFGIAIEHPPYVGKFLINPQSLMEQTFKY